MWFTESDDIKRAGVWGIRWPLSADGSGYYTGCANVDEDIRQSLRHCIFVGPGEQHRHMAGLNLRAMVWEPDDDVFLVGLRAAIRAIVQYKEPRVAILAVSAHRIFDASSIRVSYSLIYRRIDGLGGTQEYQTDVVYSRGADAEQ